MTRRSDDAASGVRRPLSPDGNLRSVETWQQLGEQLREAREARGLTVRELATAASGGPLSRAAISRVERGERIPSSQTLLALAAALEVRIVFDPAGVRVTLMRRRRPASGS